MERLKVMYIHKLCLGINLKEHISLRDLGRALVYHVLLDQGDTSITKGYYSSFSGPVFGYECLTIINMNDGYYIS